MTFSSEMFVRRSARGWENVGGSSDKQKDMQTYGDEFIRFVSSLPHLSLIDYQRQRRRRRRQATTLRHWSQHSDGTFMTLCWEKGNRTTCWTSAHMYAPSPSVKTPVKLLASDRYSHFGLTYSWPGAINHDLVGLPLSQRSGHVSRSA